MHGHKWTHDGGAQEMSVYSTKGFVSVTTQPAITLSLPLALSTLRYL